MNRSRLVNLLGVAIGIAGLTFVAVRIVQDREEIADALASSDPVWLVVAVLFGLAAMTLLGVNWLLIVRHGGAPAPWRRGLYWFFVGQLGKYVPGGIWPIVGQAELAHRDRTPRPVAYWSTAMSMVATLLGAVGVAAISGLVSPAGSRLVPILFGIGLIVGFAALASERVRTALHRLADRIADRLTGRELRLPDARWLAGIVARYLPVWVLFSGMSIFSARALGVPLDTDLVVTLIYATCVSWIAGFVIIGLPGGLGVREAV
ncbi:MAG TPA: lysylphosphatidylglycerol synthase transmembrane domain-containing protein, partial [Ilumatobacteraceae bacterium]|nr:lysylphosphatidylglycerol synthase transmembrane domain-containing protein [Ilumatobacteraceae bacterium]